MLPHEETCELMAYAVNVNHPALFFFFFEKALFIEMRREKTCKMMRQKARVKVSCTKEGLKEMIQSLRRMRTS